ncbi:C4-dicarboxylate ABC transporter permease [Pokkaliibacter plantistimulans]|uniref:TRAP transporter small permease protein n=1 Tax=Pokkaliibacter plantistimulans TaxID=1635171 RepID=A0ABX5LW58_9GAMM|nr:TRAP transporter small permease [Pokkaliibacter plantistimulans]PXF30571.1 C4-dicarboxylate ABC transporter permease [Pokkaliibacter plantistimulans]
MSERRPGARLEAILAALALSIICLISLANVVVRYATDASFAFTEEFSVFLLVVMTFAGAAVAARQNAHIRIELIEHLLPRNWLPLVYVLQWLAGVTVLAIVIWYGSTFTLEEYQWDSLSPGLGLPNWIYVIWLPILALAILLRMTMSLRDRLSAHRGGHDES